MAPFHSKREGFHEYFTKRIQSGSEKKDIHIDIYICMYFTYEQTSGLFSLHAL